MTAVSGSATGVLRRSGLLTWTATARSWPKDRNRLATASTSYRMASRLNRRVCAEVDGDGICLDAEGAIWCSGVSGGQPQCLRVREGGEVLERIVHDAACFACMLGGADGRTLFLMNAEWRGVEKMGEMFQSKTGKIETVRVAVPHAGRP